MDKQAETTILRGWTRLLVAEKADQQPTTPCQRRTLRINTNATTQQYEPYHLVIRIVIHLRRGEQINNVWACRLHDNVPGRTQGEKMSLFFFCRQVPQWDYVITPIGAVFRIVITLLVAFVYNFSTTWWDNRWGAVAEAAVANVARLKYVHTELT